MPGPDPKNSGLQRLGYSEFFEQQMAALTGDLFPARVVGQHRRQWDIATESGSTRAVLTGRRWDPERGIESADAQPTVGDWVAVRKGAPPVIDSILKRRTSLSRTSLAKRGAKQVLVANVDIVAVVAAFAHPDADDFSAKRSLSPRRIERYLLAIKQGGAAPLVLLNKHDLDPNADEKAQLLRDRLKDCPVKLVSCKAEGGLDGLLAELTTGTTIGFVGLSGVGKSSIVNRLLGRLAQKVGEERLSDARGRHTTTHRELFLADEGFILIDTPGMREFALVDGEDADLDAFTDIAELSQKCQFRDCSHREEPGCQVRQAVSAGEIDRDRLKSFHTLRSELKEQGNTQRSRKSDKSQRRPAKDTGKARRGDRRTRDED